MTFIDDFLNKITMYRLVLYYLITLLVAAAFFGFFNILPYSPGDLAFSTLLILATCWIVNTAFVKGFGALPNIESLYITGLILALLITPVAPTDYAGVGFLIFAAAWAMASKFIFAIGKKHLFNPAAFGVALSALIIGQSASWWVGGNLPLLPFVFLGGLLIVRKIHRFDLVIAFLATAFITIALTTTSIDYTTPIKQTILHSAIFFLAFVMLTEPLTMPPSRWLRVVYGAIVGFLFAPNVHLGSFYFTPELALLIGNVFVYIVSPKGRFMLTLLEKKEIADGAFEFVFAPDRPLAFNPGQYIEWTLPHRFHDDRGNRRFFTVASSPTEDTVRLGVKFYKPASSFKRALWAMKEHEQISASNVAGDFTLPKDAQKKLAFIAGGIGVTPFRSMVKHLVDTKDPRSIVLLYSNKLASEIAYKDVFDDAAQTIGMKTVYALTNEPAPVPGTYRGPISAELIKKEIPDYKERLFYISGPHGMCEAFTATLQDMGVSRFRIKTDYFPGFA
ncbi:MAG TPA: RnfABCDGE type electron transport complex subunit D [Candidatus Paceibacterota bacterium]|nr:RnfABCDGE type electron transport complex subunit D [Candidatus Paceibacterota bacterium]